MHHDWPIKKAILDLPVRLKGIWNAHPLIHWVCWGPRTRISVLPLRRYKLGLDYLCDAGPLRGGHRGLHYCGAGELYAAVLDRQFQSSIVIPLLSSHSSLVETFPLLTLCPYRQLLYTSCLRPNVSVSLPLICLSSPSKYFLFYKSWFYNQSKHKSAFKS